MASEMTTSSSFYITGGTLPGDAPSYIVRNADQELLDALRRSQFCYVLTSRQMGKSSLMVRTASRLQHEGVTCIVLDLTAVGHNMSEAQWYDGLLNLIAGQLDLEDELDAFWEAHPRLGPQQRWMLALEEVVLTACAGRVVVFVDEIDAVRSLPFSPDGFFAGIRECYNRRTQDPAFQGLTFCLLGVASPSDLIRDTRTTPFNIGHRIELSDFTAEEAAPLTEGLGVACRFAGLGNPTGMAAGLLARVLHWTGGHPYLTQRLCLAVSEEVLHPKSKIQNPKSLVDHRCHSLFLADDVHHRDDNLLFVRERLLRSEVDRAGLLDLYRQVRAGRRIKNDETNPLTDVLRLSGIVTVEQGYLRVRNRIYGQVFARAWIQEHMPNDALIKAYRQGLSRALAISSTVFIIVALGAYGFWQTDRAEKSARSTRAAAAAARKNRELYLIAESSKTQAYQEMKLVKIADAAKSTALMREKSARADAKRNEARAILNEASARQQQEIAEHLVYIADMNLVEKSYASNDFTIIRDLLEHAKHSKFRGFEWDYWQRPYHLDLVRPKDQQYFIDSNVPVVFSPDRNQILTAGWDGTANVRNLTTGRILITLKGHSGTVRSAAFSPDGKRIATGSEDNTAKVWDIGTGREMLTLRGHSNKIRSVAFSPDGKRIVTGSEDKTAKVWNTDTGRELLNLGANQGYVDAVAFSPDGTQIATGGSDGTTKIWDTDIGRELRILNGHNGFILSLAFSPDGRRIITSCDGAAKVWDVATAQYHFALRGHHTYVLSVAFSPDGQRIATGSVDRTAKLWDAATGREIWTLPQHRDEIPEAAFSPDGKRIVTGSRDGGAQVWDAQTGHEVLDNFVVTSPDRKRIVTASGVDTALVQAADTRRKLLSLRGHYGDVTCAAFSPDGKRIATGSADKTTMLWDAETGHKILTLKGHRGAITSIAFSPNGQRIVTGSSDKTARVWDAASGALISTLYGHAGLITSVAFSPGGKRIVTGSDDRTARLWDAEVGRETLALTPQLGTVKSVAFDHDGTGIEIRGAGGVSAWYSNRSKGIGTLSTVRPYQISAGSEAASASPFSADAYFVGGNCSSYPLQINTDGVLNPAPQAVYRSERWAGDNFSYTFPGLMPKAPYTIRLHFAETGNPDRRFNVKINHHQVLTDFSVINSAHGFLKAIVEQFDAAADPAGVITVTFENVTGGAKIDGIEILPRDYYDCSGWTATASSSADTIYPGNALDGNTDTHWSAGIPQASDQWFQVDMKSAHSFSKLILDNTNSPANFPRGYKVYVSNDGVHWGSPIATGNHEGANYLDYTAIEFPRQTARYIRVAQTGSNEHGWSISEFYVYP
jgi:WD40 repeat protein